METYLIYYEYFLKIIVYVYMWYLGHIIGKQQILICSKVVVKSNCTVYSVQWLNTWVTHTHNTHTQADTLTHWDSLFDTPQTSLYLNIWFKIQPLEKANIIDLQYFKKIFGRLYTALCIWGGERSDLSCWFLYDDVADNSFVLQDSAKIVLDHDNLVQTFPRGHPSLSVLWLQRQ